MSTDTRPIRTVELCAWCRIRLSAIPSDPVYYKGWKVHPSCGQAARAEDAAKNADPSCYPETYLAEV